MIRFERSTDYALIKGIITTPAVYRHLTDDNSPSAEDYQPIEHEAIWYVIVRDSYCGDEELLGLWMFHPLNSICWEVHTALLPNAWGDRGRIAARLMAEWIWEHTPCRRIVTNVPENNRLALAFAGHAGMKVYGRNPASFLKGKLLDQICLGISRPVEVQKKEDMTVCHLQQH